ncbi:LL-diaminopimelate aminotransferase [Anaerobacillus sp. MEB173]|uniref:LL-diaminopimelate aminotransferase n=1 Tax=Anaerobacillus sp. MEB173 TaxID=3383345 RepID=UPI003F928961
MITPSSRLEHLATSVFSDLAAKKSLKLQKGFDMIDLSIGSPDLPPPEFVKECLAKKVKKNDQYGYALSGTEQFKEAVAYYYKNRFNVNLASNEVLQLMGSQDGLAHLALAYLDKGDIVIVPDPGYPIYSASVHIAGGELYPVTLNEENNFKADINIIPEEICKRAKIMIVSHPGNPIPTLVDRHYFEKLIDFGKKHNILIVHDFAYCELLFDQNKPLSILSIPGAKETAIEINSLSKSFNMAGSRIGYIIGKPELLEPLAILKSHIDYGVFHPIQAAATQALTSNYQFLEESTAIYQKRRDVFIHELHKLGWNVQVPQGGMFIWAKIPEGWTSLSFALAAIDEGVIVTPGHAFGDGGEGYVRIALVQSDDRLIEAAQRLKPLITKL